MEKYTVGNWTVSANYDDTLTEAKTISVPDLLYAADYAKKEDEPTKAVIVNTTGDSIVSSEAIKFGCVPVNDIYASTGVTTDMMASSRKGVQALIEVNVMYSAVNNSTGQEIILPCRGRLTLQVPSLPCVTGDLLDDVCLRTFAATRATGDTSSERLVDIAKGSLLP